MFVFAVDLDNTLIYSEKKIKEKRCCVEWKEGRELSFIPEECYDTLQNINAKEGCLMVPVTTRSLEQYRRVHLLKKEPVLAIVANGGILLKNGEILEKWKQESFRVIAPAKEEMEKAWRYLEKDKYRCFELRNIDDMFLFTKSEKPKETIRGLENILNVELVSVIENYNKIYVMPKILNKGTAIRRLRDYIREENLDRQKVSILAAGDSSFDTPMLLEAECAVALDTSYFRKELEGHNRVAFWGGEKNEFVHYVLQTILSYVA